MLIDAHCHLEFESFDDEIDAVIDRAKKAGIGLILNVATDFNEYPDLIGIIEKYPEVYGAFGIHPSSVNPDKVASLQDLVDALHHLKIIGVGETGLDYHYENVDRKYQQESFHMHIEAARKTGLPLIVHTRDADDDLISILRREMMHQPFAGMIHCFSSSERVAKAALDLGMYISLSGIITFKKADELVDIVRKLPLERLLIETDAPYLAPLPYRGKRNEPAMIVKTFDRLAQIKGIEKGDLEAQLEQNFFKLFDKMDRAKK